MSTPGKIHIQTLNVRVTKRVGAFRQIERYFEPTDRDPLFRRLKELLATTVGYSVAIGFVFGMTLYFEAFLAHAEVMAKAYPEKPYDGTWEQFVAMLTQMLEGRVLLDAGIMCSIIIATCYWEPRKRREVSLYGCLAFITIMSHLDLAYYVLRSYYRWLFW